MKKLVLVIFAILVLGVVGLRIKEDLSKEFVYVSIFEDSIVQIPVSQLNDARYMANQIRSIPEISTMIEVGDQAVTTSEWIEVVDSPLFTLDDKKKLHEVDSCWVHFGGIITVDEVHNDDLIVEYTTPVDFFSNSCPSGVKYRLSHDSFSSTSIHYRIIRDSILLDMQLVKNLLDQNFYGETMDVGESHLIHVVNIDSVFWKEPDKYIAYGGSCKTASLEGGTIQVRGEADGMVLYEYTAPDIPKGIYCPSGVLFFQESNSDI